MPLAAVPTDDLLRAIHRGDRIAAQQAIYDGADINYRGTANNFALNGWSPLTKSIAALYGTIISTQSLINTLCTDVTTGALIGTGLAGIASLITRSPYPIAITAAIGGLACYSCAPLIKYFNRSAINDRFAITKMLLKSAKNSGVLQDGALAAKVWQDGYSLLHSQDICPPYDARTPDREYTDLLTDIVHKLPAPQQKTENAAHIENDFVADHVFEKIDAIGRLPIIFHPAYDMTLYGIEKLHPFDTQKYGKIVKKLMADLDFRRDQFREPQVAVSHDDMLRVHTQEYIDSLQHKTTLVHVADMPAFYFLPNWLLQKKLIEPVKLATQGTIDAALLALEYGWAINLGGGYHHAKRAERVDGGFCFINDICIAAAIVLEQHPEYNVLIIDLDAHQGNGHEEIAQGNPNIAIFDMYNADTWPGDYAVQERINYNYPLKSGTADKEYLDILTRELPRAIDQVKPDLIIYNAGSDIYIKDMIGRLAVSEKGIIERDDFVFQQALGRKIPIMMLLSGGYHADSYRTVSESIKNVWNKYLKNMCQQGSL